VWDNDVYAFLNGDAPDTDAPSLCDRAQLCASRPLRVVEASTRSASRPVHISLSKGTPGSSLIDPLIPPRPRGRVRPYGAPRGRPVVAVIYNPQPCRHFGAWLGVNQQEHVDGARSRDRARALTQHAVQENVYAARRWHGGPLPLRACWRVPAGMGCGLGQVGPPARWRLSAPLDIKETGETHTVDGVEIEFQMAPGTEAPAEMALYFRIRGSAWPRTHSNLQIC